MTYAILMREGDGGRDYPSHRWRQYIIVGDGVVYIVHMTPALLGGWNFGRVDRQGESEWPGMSRDEIIAWKVRNNYDGLTRPTNDLGEFGFRLIQHAVAAFAAHAA